MKSTRTPCGITVSASPLLQDGTFVYAMGETVVAVSTLKRRTWLAQFGLKEVIPDFDRLAISSADYASLLEDECMEVPFQ